MSDPSIPTPPNGAPPAEHPQAYPAPPALPSAPQFGAAAPAVPPAPPAPAPVAPVYSAPQTPGYAPAPGYGAPAAQPSPQVGYPAYGTPSYPVYAAPRPTSGLAVASLVCGLAGFLLSWLVVPALASIAAVICGHMALKQTKTNPALGGRGMAFAGLILGYVGVAVLAFVIVVPVVMFLFFGAFTLPFLFTA